MPGRVHVDIVCIFFDVRNIGAKLIGVQFPRQACSWQCKHWCSSSGTSALIKPPQLLTVFFSGDGLWFSSGGMFRVGENTGNMVMAGRGVMYCPMLSVSGRLSLSLLST